MFYFLMVTNINILIILAVFLYFATVCGCTCTFTWQSALSDAKFYMTMIVVYCFIKDPPSSKGHFCNKSNRATVTELLLAVVDLSFWHILGKYDIPVIGNISLATCAGAQGDPGLQTKLPKFCFIHGLFKMEWYHGYIICTCLWQMSFPKLNQGTDQIANIVIYSA